MTISIANATTGLALSNTIPATTAGNCLVAIIISNNSNNGVSMSVSSFKAGASEAFTQILAPLSGVDGIAVWADPNCSAGLTSFTGVATNYVAGEVVLLEVVGLASTIAALFTAGLSNHGSSTFSSSWNSGNIALPDSTRLLLGAVGTGVTLSAGPAAPWTNSNTTKAGYGYRITPPAGTYSYSGTQASNSNYQAAVIALNPSTATDISITGSASVVTGAAAAGSLRISVRASRATSWNTKQRVSPVKVSSWNSRSTVRPLNASSWNSLKQVTPATKASAWNSRKTIAPAQSCSWNTTKTIKPVKVVSWLTDGRVSSTIVTTWHTGVSTSASNFTAWNVRVGVTKTQAAAWNDYNKIVSAQATAWRSRKLLKPVKTTSWNTVSLVTPNQATAWKVRTTIKPVKAIAWNSDGTSTHVSAGVDTAWRSLGTVTSTVSTSWNTEISAAAATRSITWDALAKVDPASVACNWNDYTFGSTSQASSWAAVGRSIASRPTAWNTLIMVTDGASVTTRWNTTSAVRPSRSCSWNSRVKISAARQSSWHSRVPQTVSKAAAWRTLTKMRASRPSAVAWNTRQRRPSSAEIAWVSGGTRVPATRATAWKTKQRVSVTVATAWQVRLGRPAKQPAAWQTCSTVRARRTASWNTTKRVVGPSRSCAWKDLVAVHGVARSCAWKDYLRVKHLGNPCAWRVRKNRTAELTAKWHVSGWTMGHVSAHKKCSWITNVVHPGSARHRIHWNDGARRVVSHTTRWRVNLAPGVTISHASAWKTRKRVSASVACGWHDGAREHLLRPVEWNTRRVAASSKAIAWNAKRGISTTKTCSWNSREKIVKESATSWREIQTLHVKRQTIYESHKAVSLAATIEWKVGRPTQGNIRIMGSDRWQQAQ